MAAFFFTQPLAKCDCIRPTDSGGVGRIKGIERRIRFEFAELLRGHFGFRHQKRFCDDNLVKRSFIPIGGFLIGTHDKFAGRDGHEFHSERIDDRFRGPGSRTQCYHCCQGGQVSAAIHFGKNRPALRSSGRNV